MHPLHSTFLTLARTNAPTDAPQDRDYYAKCYIAGPMTGIENFNFPAFQEASNTLRRAEWFVYSPNENDAERGEEAREDGVPQYPLKHYMVTDLAQVCKSDAVFFLPGWENSKGAMLEFTVAQALEIPCYLYSNGGKTIIMGTSDEGSMILSVSFDELDIIGLDHHSYELGAGGGPYGRGSRAEGNPFFEEPSDAELEKAYPEECRHPGSARFHEHLKTMGDLHDRKQADYGTGEDPFANVRSSEDFGVEAWIGTLIRLNDKIKRLQSMAKKGHLVNESAYDSFKDIAVYSLIALCLYEEQYGREK